MYGTARLPCSDSSIRDARYTAITMTDPKSDPAPKKKTFTLSEEDIHTDRRPAGGSVGSIGGGRGGAGKVIDPNQRGPGAPTDPDA